jgi:3-oxoadipate enol-lactonase
MPFAELSTVRLHYELEGAAGAPVLVLSNSLGTDLHLWQPQLSALSRHYRVLRYDQRGHGQSSVPPGPYTFDALGGDVVELLDALHIECAHFCGISMGGLTGMWLGVHAAGRIGRLVLANTAARIGTAETWNARIDAVMQQGMPALAGGVLTRWFTPACLAANAPPLPALRAQLAATSSAGYAACCAALRDADMGEAIARIGSPVLVIAGTHDVSTTPADARFLAERIPHARMVELDAAHISNVEAAGAFNAALGDFLAT